MASLCHPWFTTTNLSYRFPIFETSATALCGTTGIRLWYVIICFAPQYIPIMVECNRFNTLLQWLHCSIAGYWGRRKAMIFLKWFCIDEFCKWACNILPFGGLLCSQAKRFNVFYFLQLMYVCPRVLIPCSASICRFRLRNFVICMYIYIYIHFTYYITWPFAQNSWQKLCTSCWSLVWT